MDVGRPLDVDSSLQFPGVIICTQTVEVQSIGEDDDPNIQQPQIKVLVLGAGGVGKSTLIKQFAANYMKEEMEDPESYRDIIRGNLIASMESIIRTSHRDGANSWAPGPVTYATELMATLWDYEHFNDKSIRDVCHAIRSLWTIPEVRELARQPSLCIPWEIAHDSASYFFDAVDRIVAPDYTPTHEDIIHSRVRTVGLREITVTRAGPFSWSIVDVGGARSERRKWTHSFEDATAILFVVALCDYNRVLCEDPNENRLDDSLHLFEYITSSDKFAKTPILLVFTKTDVFVEELKHAPLRDWSISRPLAPIYDGQTYDDACKYIEDRFTDLLRDKKRLLNTHYMCTVDTATMDENCTAIQNCVNQYYEQLNASFRESS